MIQNDKQLSVVRAQLARAEAALDSLRREVLPQSEQMYGVMAESYIDTILSLRADIDAYLGIVAIPQSADLVISLEGSKVGLGATSAALVTRFVDTFRRGLQSAVETLEAVKRPETSRRRERWIENICDLPLIGIVPGSVRILLGQPESLSLFSDDERESLANALDLVFDGLTWADVSALETSEWHFTTLPEPTRQSVLALVTRLLPPKNGAVERVVFQRRVNAECGVSFVRASLTNGSRERIRNELAALTSHTKFGEIEGVIRRVDLDAQTFVLGERANQEPDLVCEYGPDLEEAVKEYLDFLVIVSGSIETSRKTHKSKMSADTIELVSK